MNQGFKTKTGRFFPGASQQQVERMWQELFQKYGLMAAQVCEAAAFSMAMVVRFALGLSATGGKIFVLADDCLSGWIAAATLRHLCNAGADGALVLAFDPEKASPDMCLQAAPLQARNIPLLTLSELVSSPDAAAMIDSCHNLLCGLFNPAGIPLPESDRLNLLLNESKTPVHCIGAPLGIDVDTGIPHGTPLYASSTLSLGVPFSGLFEGNDYVGRHYLCDVSFPPEIYQAEGLDMPGMFSDQPVIQIFPNLPKEEDAPPSDSSEEGRRA